MASPPVTCLLVRAARGEPVERPPVWAMRQAGRWDPEFNRLRAGLSFYEFSENVELAAAGVAAAAPLRRRCHHPLLRHHHADGGDGPAVRAAARPRARCPTGRCGRWPTSSGWTPSRTPSAFGTSASCCARVKARAARRAAGDRLRRGAVHAGDLLHRHRQGHGRDAPLRRRAAGRLGRRCSTGSATATVHFLRHAGRGRGRRLPAVRLVGRAARRRASTSAGRSRTTGRSSRGAPACRASCSSRSVRTWT